MSFKSVKYNLNRDFTKKQIILSRSFILLFSIINLGSTDIKNLKNHLKSQGAFSRLVNVRFLKKNLDSFGFAKPFKTLLNGLLYIATVKSENFDTFNFSFDKSSKNYYLIGIFYRNKLYYPSNISLFNKLSHDGLFLRLLNILLFKQKLLAFYFKSCKLFFYKKS